MTEQEEAYTEKFFPRSASDAKLAETGHDGKPNYTSSALQQDVNANEKKCGVSEETDESTEVKPPDGGWGWLVALGSLVISTLIPMIAPCFGVLFSRYLLEEGASSTTSAWIFNVQCFAWNIMGLFTRPFTSEFGWRKSGIFGAALTAVAFVISAFSPAPEFLFFSFSLLTGIGGGSVVTICFIILPHYFERKRGVANAIMMAGVCLGQIVGPPLARFLQDEYGFRGATMIIGAILLNGCVGASLFHPVEWHLKKTPRQAKTLSQEDESLLSKLGASRGFVISHSDTSLAESTCDKDSDLMRMAMHEKIMKKRGVRHIIEASNISINSSSLCLSTMDIAGISPMPDTEPNNQQYPNDMDSRRPPSSICTFLLRIVRGTVADLGSLRSPSVCIIALSGAFFINGYLNFTMMVPFAMQAAGHSLQASAWCISISGFCNLPMRMLVSSLSDMHWFNARVCFVSGYIIASLSMLIFPFLVDLKFLMVDMAVFGCGVGAAMGLYNIIMIEEVGVQNLAAVFGACCFSVAVGFICLGPMIGMIRDMSQSYAISIWVLAATVLTSSLLWLLMPAASRYHRRKAKEKEGKELT